MSDIPELALLHPDRSNYEAYILTYDARHDYLFKHVTLAQLLSPAEYEATKTIALSLLAKMYQPIYDYGINGYVLATQAGNLNRILNNLNPDVEPAVFVTALAEVYGDELTDETHGNGSDPGTADWQVTLNRLKYEHCINFEFMDYDDSPEVERSWSTNHINQLREEDNPDWSRLSYNLEVFYQYTRLEPYLPHDSVFRPLMTRHQQFINDWHLNETHGNP